MLQQRHELQLAYPIAPVFTALVGVAGKGRWASALAPTQVPRAGSDYIQQSGSVLRRGKVLECLRPVSMTLQETLHDPPCRVSLRLHWRLEPTESGAHLLLDARISLNGAAALRRRHWDERIRAHCERMLGSVRAHLSAEES